MVSELKGGPYGANISDDTRGAIQPIISTGIAASSLELWVALSTFGSGLKGET